MSNALTKLFKESNGKMYTHFHFPLEHLRLP